MLKKIARNKIIKFFGSLQMAVVSITALAIICAVATLVEAYYSTSIAQELVYRTFWFYLILGLLASSVFFSTLTRLPWKKQHTGFLIIHLGILFLLLGSYVTMEYGVDANLTMKEGESKKVLIMNKPMLRVRHKGETFQLPVPFSLDEKKNELIRYIKLGQGKSILLDGYFPNAKMEEGFRSSANGNVVAANIGLKGFMGEEKFWLSSQKPEIKMGPATFRLVQLKKAGLFSPVNEAPEVLEEPQMIFKAEGLSPIKKAIEFDSWTEIKIGSRTLFAKAQRYLKRARVEENKLVDKSEGAVNPAVEVFVYDESKENLVERHVAFALMPDFPSRMARSKEKTGLRIFLHDPELSRSLAKGQKKKRILEFGYFKNEEGISWNYRVINDDKVIKEAQIKEGETFEPGWMNMKITTRRLLERGKYFRDYESRKLPSGKEPNPPAIHLTSYLDGYKHAFKLGMGDVYTLGSGPDRFEFLLTYKSFSLPFDLKLEDFHMNYDPGTKKPASYESFVSLPTAQERGKIKISMNNPLKHENYTFYQSSYAFDEKGEPTISTLSVNQDPGREIKYAGSLIMVLGMIIYYARKKAPRKILE